MKLTKWFNFKKPDPLDTVNINDINDSFDLIDEKLKETEDENKSLSQQFKNLIINAGNSNAEVAAARGDFDFLPDRLDAVDEQFNTITQQTDEKILELSNSKKGNETMFCFIDDDAKKAVFTRMKPLFDKYNAKFGVSVISSRVGVSDTQMNISELLQLQNEGHTMLSHTVNHVELTTVSDVTELEDELKNSKEQLEKLGLKINHIAYPNGAYNDLVLSYARKYYKSGLNTEINFNTKPLKTCTIYRKSIGEYGDRDIVKIKQYIDDCITKKVMCIFTTHVGNFTEDDFVLLEDTIKYIISKGGIIKSYNEAFEENKNIFEHGEFSTTTMNYAFAVGDTGECDGYSINNLQILNPNEILNGRSVTSNLVKNNAISVNTVSNANAGGLPESTGGVLITYKLNGGYYYQEYRVYRTNNIYTRYADVNNTWTSWVKQTNENDNKYLISSLNAYNGNSALQDFPSYKVTSTGINGSTASLGGLPTTTGGVLITYRVENDAGYCYQTYKKYKSNEMWIRYADSLTTWGTWQKITVV